MIHTSLQYCSDLHLEFQENENFIKINPITPKANILLLAGDIMPFRLIEKFDWFWDKLGKDFKEVYWVPGNHEYYHSDINNYNGPLSRKIRDNVSLVNNITLHKEDVSIIFSTLWSEIRPHNRWMIEKRLNDFQMIQDGKKLLTVNYYNLLHKISLEFITEELKRLKQNKVIICTHHVPTFLNYPDKYKGDLLNDAFVTELFSLIDKYQPTAWIYGHHHYNPTPFKIGKTEMLTNQLGYVINNEQNQFNTSAFVPI